MTLTGTEVRTLLLSAGFRNGAVNLGDDLYQLPRSSWVLGEFDDWFRSVLTTLALGYSEGDWDYDDFSDLFAVLARICHKKTPHRVEGAALPVGVLYYVVRPGSAHAIAWAVTSDKGLVFIELQRRAALVNLTPEQINSSWYVKC